MHLIRDGPPETIFLFPTSPGEAKILRRMAAAIQPGDRLRLDGCSQRGHAPTLFFGFGPNIQLALEGDDNQDKEIICELVNTSIIQSGGLMYLGRRLEEPLALQFEWPEELVAVQPGLLQFLLPSRN